MENRNRLYLDVVKGIAVFLMLWGHCIQYCALGSFSCFDNVVFETIYTFHMPLFMLVSGYLYFFSFQKRDLKTLLVHRAQSLLQPIVFCTVLYNLLMNLAYQVFSGTGVLFNGTLFTGMPYMLWFLWCVLGSSVAVGIACKVTDKGWLQGILLTAGVFFVALFQDNSYQLFMYPFFVGGFLFAKHKASLLRMIGKWKYAALVIFPAMLPFYERKHYIYITPFLSGDYDAVSLLRINTFRILIGFAGSAFVLVLVDMLFCATVRRGHVPKVLKAVGKIGENSLQIYCLSVPLLSGYLPVAYEKLMLLFGYNVFAENMTVYSLLFTPLLAAAYSAGLYAVVLILKKLKIHALIFGR